MEATYLTNESVSILTLVDGQNARCAYANSATGRKNLASDCPPEIVSEVMSVWGDTPTVPEYIPEPMPESPPPTPTEQQQINAVLFEELARLKAKEGNPDA